MQRTMGNQAVQRALDPQGDFPASMPVESARVQRKCAACEREHDEQKDVAPEILAQLGPGRPFEGVERARMERAFGQDFSHVRVHTDEEAARVSEDLDAYAFTVANHIGFSRGAYHPGTPVGDALLAHELAHTLQQKDSVQSLSVFDRRDGETDALEDDADLAALRAVKTLWGKPSGVREYLPDSAMPRLRSRLRLSLSNCGGKTTSSPACGAPVSMTKVTSGAFEGGKSMDDYYPDLAGGGFWAHGKTAGPFDTGAWVGSNVQLIGTYPNGCDSSKYALEQTVSYKKAIFDGKHHANEGKTWDDIAASGRDASKAPFRQEWDSKISMADPPALKYTGVKDAEWDRDFETALRGPSGRASVKWSTSIRVKDGAVTTNTVS